MRRLVRQFSTAMWKLMALISAIFATELLVIYIIPLVVPAMPLPFQALMDALILSALLLPLLYALIYRPMKTQERDLKHRENRFRAIADHTANWESWFSPTGKNLWTSPSVEALTGYTPEECMRMPDYPIGIIHPSQRDHMRRRFAEALTERTEGRGLEALMLRKDGSSFWLSVSWTPVFMDGEYAGIRTSGQDIDDRKRIEQALHESEEGFRTFFEQSSSALSIVSLEGYPLKINRALTEMLGYSREELVGRSFVEFTHPEDAERQEFLMYDLISGALPGFQMEKRYIRRDGQSLHVLLSYALVRNADGTPRHFIAQMQDISPIKRMQGQLEAAMREKDDLIGRLDMLYRAIEATQVGITICDEDRNIIYVNEADARMHGYTVGELMGQKTVIYGGNPREGQRQLSILGVRDGWVRESVNVRKDGSEFPVMLSSIFIRDEGGRPNAMVTACEDITLIKENEVRLERALRQREMLIKEVHHRVKNNLSVVQSLLNLQASRIGDAASKGVFEETRNRVRAMGMIHERLYQSNDLSTLDFGDYLGSLVRQLHETYCTNPDRVSLTFDLPAVSLDVDTIIPCGLIVNELMTNVFKYAFPGDRSGKVYVGLQRGEEGLLHLVVRDDGVGLPGGFDINNTNSLGMKIVSALSAQLGRDVMISSGDWGTEFRVLLLRPSLKPIVWNDATHITGHAVIDAQHRHIFEAVEGLGNAIEWGRQEEGLRDLIPALLQYVNEHFKTEEAIMDGHEYPRRTQHAQLHRDFELEVSAMISEIRAGRKGLSLSVYAYLAEWLSGHIGEADAELGRFIRQLGLDNPEAPAPDDVRHGQSSLASDHQVLVVEDDRIAQIIMGRFLEDSGYSHLTVSSGPEAMDAIGRFRFEFIISDMRLPGGMDGIQLIRGMRDQGVSAPALYLTGMDRDELAGLPEDLNIVGILTKPVSFGDLGGILSRHIGA